MTALRALLAGIVDYAGLFPPASLDMASTVANYARYVASPHAWMLGRLVVPVARFDEFLEVSGGIDGREHWQIAAIVGADREEDFARIDAHNARGGPVVDVAEVRAGDGKALTEIAARIPIGVRPFVEFPPGDTDLLREVARLRLRAKIRTGGVTPDAIPDAGTVADFIRRCYAAGVAFKATAGLHHPLRSERALTYEADSPRGVMHGFLNVFLAAAFCFNGLGAADAPRLLDVADAESFEVGEDAIAWEGYRVSTAEIEAARRRLAASFGSCSFIEPVEDLEKLELI